MTDHIETAFALEDLRCLQCGRPVTLDPTSDDRPYRYIHAEDATKTGRFCERFPKHTDPLSEQEIASMKRDWGVVAVRVPGARMDAQRCLVTIRKLQAQNLRLQEACYTSYLDTAWTWCCNSPKRGGHIKDCWFEAALNAAESGQ